MDGLQSNEVNALLADADGAVWVGTQLGVCRWRENEVEQFNVPKEIVCFLQDDSNGLWAGGNGLYHFNGTRWNQIDVVGKAKVNGLAHDPAGRIWMATSKGLKVYDGFAVQTLTSSDGALEGCSDVIWDQRENSVLVVGDRLVSYHPRNTPPSIAITGIAADKEYESTSEVRFASSQPFLNFEFHGISFKTRSNAMRYRYRLRGFEDEWKLTEKPQVSYDQLSPGEYTFEVQAIDRDLNYSLAPATVQVHVDREYGQAVLWSSLGCALVAVVVLSLGAWKNINKRKQMEGEIQEVNRSLAAIVESSDDAIMGATLDGKLTSWNRGAQRLFGYSAAEVIGQPLAIVVPRDRHDEVADFLERIKKGENVDQFETVRLRKDGAHVDVSLTISPIINSANGTTIGASTIARDMTEQKRIAETRKRTERLVSIGTLAAGVAHELNNPVGAMVLTAEEALLELEETGLQEVAGAPLHRLVSQAQRCSKIVSRLLQFANQHPNTKSIQDLRTIVNDAVDLIRHKAAALTIEFDIQPADGCFDVLANSTELAQVFVNLFANAIQASQPKSVITVSFASSDNGLAVAVKDCGCGIAESDQEKIFDPFYTTHLHADAVGLGLSIAHGIVVDHGGTMHVSSQANEGTCFTVLVPPDGAHGTESLIIHEKGRFTRVD